MTDWSLGGVHETVFSQSGIKPVPLYPSEACTDFCHEISRSALRMKNRYDAVSRAVANIQSTILSLGHIA